MKPKKKPVKLTGRTRSLASRYIAEEMHTKKYPAKQAIAIGISRAKTETKRRDTLSKIARLLKKYRLTMLQKA